MLARTEIDEAIEGLQSDDQKIRERHFKNLLLLSEESPEQLYRGWDKLTELLQMPEVSRKYAAIHLLANLVRVDTEDEFERMFDDFYALLSHESPVVSPHIAGTSGKIILAKPHLRSRITSLLLDIDAVNKCRHPELLKSYVIQAFDECFDNASKKEQSQIIEFVRNQTTSDSPKTKKAAKQFLKKWSF